MTVRKTLWISLFWSLLLTTQAGAETREQKLHAPVPTDQVLAKHEKPDRDSIKPVMASDNREREPEGNKVATMIVPLPSTIEKMQF